MQLAASRSAAGSWVTTQKLVALTVDTYRLSTKTAWEDGQAERMEEHGYGLLIHDGYRPWYVTKMFWDATPESLKVFVADPASGSRHNRGAASHSSTKASCPIS